MKMNNEQVLQNAIELIEFVPTESLSELLEFLSGSMLEPADIESLNKRTILEFMHRISMLINKYSALEASIYGQTVLQIPD